jgi:hypothetical protein
LASVKLREPTLVMQIGRLGSVSVYGKVMLSCGSATVDGVLIGNRIYWTLTDQWLRVQANYNRFFNSHNSQFTRASCIFTSRCLLTAFSDGSFPYSGFRDRIENTAPLLLCHCCVPVCWSSNYCIQLSWKYACLQNRYLATDVYFLITRSLRSNGSVCHNIEWDVKELCQGV